MSTLQQPKYRATGLPYYRTILLRHSLVTKKHNPFEVLLMWGSILNDAPLYKRRRIDSLTVEVLLGKLTEKELAALRKRVKKAVEV